MHVEDCHSFNWLLLYATMNDVLRTVLHRHCKPYIKLCNLFIYTSVKCLEIGTGDTPPTLSIQCVCLSHVCVVFFSFFVPANSGGLCIFETFFWISDNFATGQVVTIYQWVMLLVEDGNGKYMGEWVGRAEKEVRTKNVGRQKTQGGHGLWRGSGVELLRSEVRGGHGLWRGSGVELLRSEVRGGHGLWRGSGVELLTSEVRGGHGLWRGSGVELLRSEVRGWTRLTGLAPTTDNVCYVTGLAPTTDNVCYVTGLAPTTANVCYVTGLAPTTANVCYVTGLAPTTDNVCYVTGLAPTTANVCYVTGLAPTTANVCYAWWQVTEKSPLNYSSQQIRIFKLSRIS